MPIYFRGTIASPLCMLAGTFLGLPIDRPPLSGPSGMLVHDASVG